MMGILPKGEFALSVTNTAQNCQKSSFVLVGQDKTRQDKLKCNNDDFIPC
jgi:hypothetical protein